MSFLIRSIQSSDYPNFGCLFELCFPGRPMTTAAAEAIFRDEPALIYVACETKIQAIVGFLYAWHVADEIQIMQMAVDPAWRRQGVGEALIYHTREKARDKALKLTLEVRIDNIGAIKLYEKTGFFRVGLRKNYYDGMVDGLLMDSLVG